MWLDEATTTYDKSEPIVFECLEYFLWGGIASLQIRVKVIEVGPEEEKATSAGVKSGRRRNNSL